MNQETEIFRLELFYQKECAVAAYKLARDNISKNDFWIYIQLFLVAAANISKCMFFSSKESSLQSKVERSKRLRDAFKVSDLSPLEDRHLRNHFEHFDERIDAWIAQHPEGGLFVDRNSVGITVPVKKFRHLNPKTMEISYGEESYDINVLYSAIINLPF